MHMPIPVGGGIRGSLRRRLARLAVSLVTLAVAGGMAGHGTAPPWAPATAFADGSFDGQLFSLLNQDRAANGVGPLQLDSRLASLSEAGGYSGCGYRIAGRAADMIQRNYFAHTILNCGGQNVFNMMAAYGVPTSTAGENIGWVSGTTNASVAAQYVNNQFMASPDHRANILNPRFTIVGVGSWWTAAGQTWSGGGAAQSNVVMATEEFAAGPAAGAPVPAAVPPPVRSSAPPPPRAQTAPHPGSAPSTGSAPAPPPSVDPAAAPAPAPPPSSCVLDCALQPRHSSVAASTTSHPAAGLGGAAATRTGATRAAVAALMKLLVALAAMWGVVRVARRRQWVARRATTPVPHGTFSVPSGEISLAGRGVSARELIAGHREAPRTWTARSTLDR
jgi:uncharacterized protein YkwD